jgi:hypothetical protein
VEDLGGAPHSAKAREGMERLEREWKRLEREWKGLHRD